MEFDLIIANGTVIDPANGLNGEYDIGICDGKIASVYPRGKLCCPIYSTIPLLDVKGCIVTPGLIDIHAHVFPGRTTLGIDADKVGIKQGVTTLVDAGSSGAANFHDFMEKVIDQSKTRVLAWINIANDGLCSGLSELSDMTKLDISSTAEIIRRYPAIRGIKVRMSSSVLGGSGLKPLILAKQLSRELKIPVMVHVGNGPPALGDILDLLDKGDIVTHIFHGKSGGLMDSSGMQPIPQVREAIRRGVLFDVGHGTSSFSFRVLRKAVELGIRPDSISTDIYLQNYEGPVKSLTVTLSKFLALGFTLYDTIASATALPAKAIGLEDEIGTLSIGATADISIFTIQNGVFDFCDSEGEHIQGIDMLTYKYIIKAGKLII